MPESTSFGKQASCCSGPRLPIVFPRMVEQTLRPPDALRAKRPASARAYKTTRAIRKTLTTFIPQRDQAGQVTTQFVLADSDREARKKALEATTEYKELHAKASDLNKQLERMKAAVIKTATERYQGIARSLDYYFQLQTDLESLLHEVTLAMKADLGIRTDEPWYRDKMQIAAERAIRLMKEQAESNPVIKQLRAKLEQRPASENQGDTAAIKFR